MRGDSAAEGSDAALIRVAARRVATTITLAVSLLVLAVLVGAFSVVLTQVPLGDFFAPQRHESVVDIEGSDILLGGVLLGAFSIASAGFLGWWVTRRAVRPLADALRRQRQFVADASHELRTPLAILDSRLQMLQRSLTPADPHAEIVSELRSDSRALINVVTDLLEGLDEPVPTPASPADVGRTIDATIAGMSVLAEQRDVRLESESSHASLLVRMPESSLRRSMTALLDNAVKHSPAGTAVTVSARRRAGFVLIDVADNGPGIQGIAPERVFDRFARSSEAIDGGGSARTGFGIGLALVQNTVTRYGGSAEVTTSSPAGTTITLRVPAVTAPTTFTVPEAPQDAPS